jgi:hypothetical protein
MKILFLAIAISFVSPSVYGWGAKGHQIVGHIAQDNLSEDAKSALKKIFGPDLNLAKESTWPDEVRSIRSLDRFKPWHFADYPTVPFQTVLGKTKIEEMKEKEKEYLPLVEGLLNDHPYLVVDHAAKGDAIQAMSMMRDLLRSPRATVAQKQFAVRYIVHILGDVHQPLHIGSGEDLGGNSCMVTWKGEKTIAYPKEGGGESTVPLNLHIIWDDILPNQRKCGTELCNSKAYTEFLYSNYKDKIKDEKKKWIQGSDLDWTKESADMRESVYPTMKSAEGAPISIEGKKAGRPYCKGMAATTPPEVIPPELMPDLGDAYLAEFQTKMELRMLQAGYRLAEQLNRTFAKKKRFFEIFK